MTGSSRLSFLALAGWIVAGAALVAAAWLWTHRARPVPAPVQVPVAAAPEPVPAAPPTLPGAQAQESWEAVIRAALPALVQVETSRGQGSGFFISADTLLTNVHVVSGASYVTLRFADKSTAQASVVKSEPAYDVALLRLWNPRPGQTSVALGTAEGLQPGQEVVAIGSPHGIQNTVTRGIVSGLRRAGAVGLVQTDAALNPGNSGGPLLDRQGRAVGVNTLSFRQAQGIHFAVAIEHARALIEGRAQPSLGGGGEGAVEGHRLPDPSGPSESERQRLQGTRVYEARMLAIAQRAATLDDYWAQFMASGFDGRVAGSYSRPWYVLWEPENLQGTVRPGYAGVLHTARRRAEEIRSAVRFTEEEARKAGVYPGDLREIRARYRLDYPGWER